MHEPSVSICLTAYNRAASIGATIDSLLAQQFGDFELIISDDCSTDGTQGVCRQYERLDRRVRYYRTPQNVGMPGNLNAGLRQCRAELVANLHDGDLFKPTLIGRWVEGLGSNRDAAFAFCQLESPLPSVRIRHPELPERVEPGRLLDLMLSDEYCFASPVWGTVMGRRSIYEEVGWFDPRFSYFADVWMWMRLNWRHPVVYVREPLISLMPHEADRPHARLDWRHERIIVSMYEDAAELLHADDPTAAEGLRRRIDGKRARRWAWQIGSALRRSNFAAAEEGLAMCRTDRRLALRALGYAGLAQLIAARHLPGYGGLMSVLDRLLRGRHAG
jgi:glycosyltransferase involved in cell wall biosynthesis